MKKKGILNSNLSRVVAAMGHTDKLVIADSGLPIPRRAELIDLALKTNVPRFLETLETILEELVVEEAVIAQEMEVKNKELYKKVREILKGVKIVKVSHEKFKQINGNGGNISFVRTGEATPYANIILISGVNFD
jgi:D-ribose pyranase